MGRYRSSPRPIQNGLALDHEELCGHICVDEGLELPTLSSKAMIAGVASLTLVFRDTDPRSSTNLWVGAWWDNGTYGSNADGVRAYFQAHPNATGHHTVLVIVG